MSLLATLILLYFIIRYALDTVRTWHDGQQLGSILTGILTASLFIPLVAVWA
jgi:hypothetical protein